MHARTGLLSEELVCFKQARAAKVKRLSVSFARCLSVKLLPGTLQHIVANSNTISRLICQGQHVVPGIRRTQSAFVNVVFMVTSLICQCPDLNH